MPQSGFNLSDVFATLARTIPSRRALIWRNRDLTFAQMNSRIDGVAHFLVSAGLGCYAERNQLASHESGQDHLGLYLRNGNEYLEAMIGAYRARVAPFNINYRYVDAELSYVLEDANTRGLVYHAEFAPRVAAIRDKLPNLRLLIQVADHSDTPLLPGAIDYETIVKSPAPPAGMPIPSPDDLFLLYTGGTTGMPKGVMWRQNDVFITSMGGRPFGSDEPFPSYDALAQRAAAAPTNTSVVLVAPLMHGAAQWGAFNIMTMGGWVAIPDNVTSMQPAEILRLVEREGVMSIPVVGDAMARPLIDEIETGNYDLSKLISLTNGGAALTPGVRSRLRNALPNLLIIDTAGASESGLQMSATSIGGATDQAATFVPGAETAVLAEDLSRVLAPGDGQGWLARRDLIPLGYLADAEKTARTFPCIDGVRWSVPGDRGRYLHDGRIELLGRESMTINSGGEKIFVEEVERAMSAHPAVDDVVVVGRPSERWGQEVVAIVALSGDGDPTDDDLIEICAQHVARYKLPKAIIRMPRLQRSPAGKADYPWAKAVAIGHLAASVSPAD